ncbi:MAG: UDP-2,4-diacetamido-2,4,6-trideoxy-beta-L-altropyranose hydrolase [Tissierellia bacterium]|nr:UDP-2,4-diacetamido-2,4,6-trideoxy-beta-L-altropyranose hydrolase [Tissierellia bacterium]
MKVKIFTEGGFGIGLGHISRCSSLYDEVVSRGIEAEFVIHGNFKNVDLLKGMMVKNVNWLSEDYLNNHINNTDYCIVDSYLASEELYQIISNKSKKALFIDDNARIKYPKGIIVNPSLSVDGLNYPQNDEYIYLLGDKYIILRSPFVNVKKNIINKDVKEVLITMGGSDPKELTPKILNGICKNYPLIKFNVVIGNAFRKANLIERIELNNIEFHYNVDAELMKNLMLKSDFAITAAGQTVYELLAIQTPFIPIKIAENQSNNIQGLRMINPHQVIIEHEDKFFLKRLEKEFKTMLCKDKRENLAKLYKNQVEGLGNKRIVDSLLGEIDMEKSILIRNVKSNDIDNVFNLSNQDYVRKYSINKEKINWEDHISWFNNTIQDRNIVFYVITDDMEQFLGQIRYKINDSIATVSISLSDLIIGKGYSKFILLKSMEKLFSERNEVNEIIAYVLEKNIPSVKIFENAGFLFHGNHEGLLKYIYSKEE